jgi:hypothetical protein
MRTKEQIIKIKSQIEDPRSVENFLSQEETDYLVDLYEKFDNSNNLNLDKIKKNTGPVTLDIKPLLNDRVISSIVERIKQEIGTFEMTAGFFFKTDYPHIIHNDDTFELPDTVYKAITIPLFLENFKGVHPKLCFFDQFYFHGPAKFFKGSSDIPTYYNKQVYDYSNVENSAEYKFIDTDRYFTHLKPQWLSGLSLNSALDWIPGSAIIFDSVRLHCASDFRNLGITSKLGISIFTKK